MVTASITITTLKQAASAIAVKAEQIRATPVAREHEVTETRREADNSLPMA